MGKKKKKSSQVVVVKKKKMLKLRSSDGEVFDVEERVVAMLSTTIANMIGEEEDDDNILCTSTTIPVACVTGKVLARVLDYCNEHAAAAAVNPDDNNSEEAQEELKSWDDKFVDVDTDALRELILAAHYLEIKSLMDLICQKVGNLIKGKSVEQIRETFNIKNDLTPEEEKDIRDQNPWAFD